MFTEQPTDMFSSKAKRVRANRWRKGLDRKDGEKVWAERFKTKMCKNFEDQGHCPYESRCMFAHGDHDLRTAKQNLEDGLVSERAIREWRNQTDSDIISPHSDSSSVSDEFVSAPALKSPVTVTIPATIAAKPKSMVAEPAPYPVQVAMSWKAIVMENIPQKKSNEPAQEIATEEPSTPMAHECIGQTNWFAEAKAQAEKPVMETIARGNEQLRSTATAHPAYFVPALYPKVVLPNLQPRVPSVIVTKTVETPSGPKQLKLMRHEPYSWAAIAPVA